MKTKWTSRIIEILVKKTDIYISKCNELSATKEKLEDSEHERYCISEDLQEADKTLLSLQDGFKVSVYDDRSNYQYGIQLMFRADFINLFLTGVSGEDNIKLLSNSLSSSVSRELRRSISASKTQRNK